MIFRLQYFFLATVPLEGILAIIREEMRNQANFAHFTVCPSETHEKELLWSC
jgi:hypothetical protein